MIKNHKQSIDEGGFNMLSQIPDANRAKRGFSVSKRMTKADI